MKKKEIEGFIPERLTAAREARGLTAALLGDLTGVSRQSISAYEKRNQSPSQATLAIIAEKLNLPVNFFFKPIVIDKKKQIFFRSLSGATKKSRKILETKTEWLIDEIIPYLEQFIEVLPIKLPEFDAGPHLSNFAMEDIDGIATQSRRYFNIGDGPISNMTRLLENNGIFVIYQSLNDPKLDAFSVKKEKYVVVLNSDKESAVRSRFDAAHELGHLVMHKSIKPSVKNIALIEKQAFRFASAFLLPAEAFTSDFNVPSLDAFCALKNKWKVSIAAMIMRCRDLDIINEEQTTRLFIKRASRGWARKEPLDDVLQAEQPVFIRRCFELIIREGKQTREDVMLGIPLAASDIEILAGLPLGYFSQKTATIEMLPQLKKTSAQNVSGQTATLLKFPKK